VLEGLWRKLGFLGRGEAPRASTPAEQGITAAQREAVVKVLERADGFDLVETAALAGLVEKGASLLVPAPDVLFCEHEIPEEAFYVALTGRVRSGKSGGAHAWEQAAPAVVGLRELIDGREMDADVAVIAPAGEALVIVKISAAVYREVLLSDPDFRRAVGRGGGGRAEESAAPERASSVYLLVTDAELDPRVSRVVPGLTELLAETIATHLYDEVLVFHLGLEGCARPADVVVEHRWTSPGERLSGDPASSAALPPTVIDHPIEERFARPRPVRIEYRFRELPAEGSLDDLLKSEGVAPGDERAVLVDLGAARDRVRFTPCNVVYLSASPTASPALRLLGKAALVRTAVLDAPAPAPGAASRPAWPLGAVRVRFAPALLARLAEPARDGQSRVPVSLDDLGLSPADRGATAATLERWARAVTGRRVGLSLGGGGPYGFHHGAFIASLLAAGIPVDMVSGSSVGATVGAYYCVLGEAGLRRFEDTDKSELVDLLQKEPLHLGAAFEAFLEQRLGDGDLRDLEVPFFPVVTDALTGAEWDIRRATVAVGVRASGSLPPLFSATVIENRRYLDGGLVANVPSRVLRREGCALVIASNPVCDVDKQARAEPDQASSSFLVTTVNEGRHRLTDSLRMVQMLFGALGDTQIGDTDVAFRPRDADHQWTPPVLRRLFGAHPRGPAAAPDADTARVDLARNLAVNAWRGLLRNPPSRVWIDAATSTIRVDARSRILFQPRSPRLDPSCLDLVHELAALILRLDIRALTLQVTASSLDLARSRAVLLRQQLALRDVVVEIDGQERVSIAPRVGPEDAVELVGVEARKEEAARERRHEQARSLTASARARLGKVDPDLVRMLAIEAAALEQTRETDALLRDALLLPPGRLHSFAGDGDIVSLAWHPEGRLLAVGSYTGRVRVLDTASGQAIAEYRHAGAGDRVTSVKKVVWTPDGQTLISTGEDRRIYRVSVDSGGCFVGEPVSIGDTGPWAKFGAAVSPDGTRVLTMTTPPAGSGPGLAASACLAIRALPGGAAQRVLAHDGVVTRAVWDAASDRVISGTLDGTLSIWNATTGELTGTRASPGMGTVVHLAWSGAASDAGLAVAFDQGAVVYRTSALDRASMFECLGHQGSILRIAWSPRGDSVVTASRDRTARIWDVATGTLRMVVRAASAVVGAAFYPDPRLDLLATWSTDGTTQIWDARSGESLAVLTGQSGSMRVAEFSPVSAMLATGSKDGTIAIWVPGPTIPRLDPPVRRDGRSRKSLNGASWQPDGGRFALVTGDDGSIRLWDPRDGTVQTILDPREITEMADLKQSTAAAAAYSPDGKLVAYLRCPDRVPTLRSASDPAAPTPLLQEPRATFPFAGPFTSYMLFWSPDSRYLAVNFIRAWTIWDVTTGEPVRWQSEDGAATWEPSVNAVRWIAWDPVHPGRFAVARWRTKERTVEIWDIHRAPEAPLERFCVGTAAQPTGDAALRLAWSPDGTRLAAGHNDGVTRVYDPDTGALVAHLPIVPVRPIVWVVWSPGPEIRYLATGDYNGRVTVLARVPAEGRAAETYVEVSRVDGAPPHSDAIRHLLWSRDGARLISSDVAGVIAVWELDSSAPSEGAAPRWTVTARLEGAHEAIVMAALDPDEKSLLTASADGIARCEPIDFTRLRDAVGAQLSRREMTAEEWTECMRGDRRPTWTP
jgi:WD40 repeat protein/predicted acylesterase/phospholipase RssA